ncbi:hypothetical protein L9F63_016920, partial [Diploptera punctata]
FLISNCSSNSHVHYLKSMELDPMLLTSVNCKIDHLKTNELYIRSVVCCRHYFCLRCVFDSRYSVITNKSPESTRFLHQKLYVNYCYLHSNARTEKNPRNKPQS